jgi:catalase
MEIPARKLNNSLSSILPTMTSNSNQMDASQHPLEAIAAGIQTATSSEHRGNRVSHMMSTNEGPADIIGKVSGAVPGGKRTDDGPYFTNNEGIPFPDPYVFCYHVSNKVAQALTKT